MILIIIHNDLLQKWQQKQEEFYKLLDLSGNHHYMIIKKIKETRNKEELEILNQKKKELEKDIIYLNAATEQLREFIQEILLYNKCEGRAHNGNKSETSKHL
jgi:hypothetical protein